MYQPDSSDPFIECTQNDLELRHIKTEPEVPTENLTENQGFVHLDEKYQIKKEEVEISDEKYNVALDDLERDLFNEESSLENLKFENNSNVSDVRILTDIENIKSDTQEESSNAFEQKKGEDLKSVGDITFVEVKGYFEDVHQEIRDSHPSCKFKEHNEAALPKDISDEEKRSEIYIRIDGCEPKQTGNEKSVAPRKAFKCIICSYTAKNPSRIKIHFSQVHSEIRNFSCPHCNYAAKRNTTLKRHVLHQHENKSRLVETRSKVNTENQTLDAPTKALKCTLCSFTATVPCRIRDHLSRVHSQVRSFSCPHCDFAAKTKINLHRHIRSKHEDIFKIVRFENETEKKYKCTLCPYTAQNPSRIKEHFDGIHSGIRNFSCPHCKYAAKRKSTLKLHILNIHENKSGLVKARTRNELPVAPSFFKCALCSFTAERPNMVKEHFSQIHLKSSSFSCYLCDYAADTEDNLKRHIQSTHEEKSEVATTRSKMVTRNETWSAPSEAFKCTLCSYTSKTPSRIEVHFSEVHLEIRSFGCPHCDYTAKTKGALKGHILTKHENNKPGVVRRKYSCDMCDKRFARKFNLDKHIKSVHLMIKTKCTECDYQTVSENTLNAHILSVHHPENLFKCYNCGHTTLYKNQLKVHIMRKHVFDTNRIFKCKYCPFTSTIKLNLYDHIREEHSEGCLFKCPHCEFKSIYIGHVTNHVNIKHNKVDFVCEVCGQYRSKYEKNVRTHMSKVHGIKQTKDEVLIASRKPLKCTLCSFIGKRASCLKSHFIQVHSEERNFRCPHCDYAAKQKGSLKMHILSKHEDQTGNVRKKQVCHTCQKEFVHKFTLKDHIKREHLY